MTIFNSYVCLPSNEMELFWRRCGGRSVWTALLLSQCVDAPFPAACWLLPDANRLQPSFLVFGVVAKADCFVPWHAMQLRCIMCCGYLGKPWWSAWSFFHLMCSYAAIVCVSSASHNGTCDKPNKPSPTSPEMVGSKRCLHNIYFLLPKDIRNR